MDDTRPRTLWAIVSLVCGILAWCGLVAFGLLAGLHEFSDTTGVTLGLWILCLVFPSGVLCVLAVIFGFIALLRIQSGHYGGRGAALTGIILGGLPLAFALVSYLLRHAGSNLLGW
jgi:hypothetical protein